MPPRSGFPFTLWQAALIITGADKLTAQLGVAAAQADADAAKAAVKAASKDEKPAAKADLKVSALDGLPSLAKLASGCECSSRLVSP